MEMDIQIPGVPKKELARKTPMVAHKIMNCVVTYEDGTVVELPIDTDEDSLESGFHRVNDVYINGKELTQHEVFIVYGRHS